MINIHYKSDDFRYIFLTGDQKELKELEKYLNKIPSYMFLPSYTAPPKPEVYLNKFKTKDGVVVYWAHSGLYKTIYDWGVENKVTVNGIENNLKYTKFDMSQEDFTAYVKRWNLSVEPRPYQLKAAWLILKYNQSLSELATRAGKTLIGYIVFRAAMEKLGVKKILMIVPSIQLVKQGVEDMSSYAEFFKSETVWAQGELCESSNLTIGTFQSLVKRADKKSAKYSPSFFSEYDLVCVDEAHKLQCKSINTILSQPFMKNVKLKFGFTGTLPDEGTIESFACHSLMGPTIQQLKTAELVDEGYLAKPVITQIRISHPESESLDNEYITCGEYLVGNDKKVDGKVQKLPEEQRRFTMVNVKTLPFGVQQAKRMCTKNEYKDYLIDLCKNTAANLLMLEQMLVHNDIKRLDIIKRIINSRGNQNCIVFAHHVEYIKFLAKYIEQYLPQKIVLVITGSITLKKRQAIIKTMNENQDVILVASFACVGTGLTFKNVDYAINAQSFKSSIINQQALGRGLLKSDEKNNFYLYDLIDIWPTKRIYSQGLAKIRLYKKEKFQFYIKEL